MKIQTYYKRNSKEKERITVYIDETTIDNQSAYLVALKKINCQCKMTPKTIQAVKRLLASRASKFINEIYRVLTSVGIYELYTDSPSYVLSCDTLTADNFKNTIDITDCFPAILKRKSITVLLYIDKHRGVTRECFICKNVDRDGIVYRYLFYKPISEEKAKHYLTAIFAN